MLNVIQFELRFRRRQPSTYIFFGLLFLMGFLFIATDVVRTDAGGKMMLNSPYMISNFTILVTALGAIIVSALVGTAVYRDFESNVHELFFTTRLTKISYFLGRFIGAYLVSLIVFSGVLFGIWAGTLMPWNDPAKLLPFHYSSYTYAFGVLLAPNLLLLGAMFFTFGALTRSLLAIYVQGITFLVGYLIAINFLQNVENRVLVSLIDPFGLSATRILTLYWTIEEKNTRLIPMDGSLIANRLCWIIISLVIFSIGCRLFSFSSQQSFSLHNLFERSSLARVLQLHALSMKARTANQRAETVTVSAQTQNEAAQKQNQTPDQIPIIQHSSPLQTYLQMTRFYLRDMARSVPFLTITLMGMLLLIVSALQANKYYDTSVYPVTRIMAQEIFSSFGLFFIILITFFAGELTWKERVLRLDQIVDCQPIGTAPVLLGKISALVLMQCILLVVLMLTGMLVQIGKGYTHLEPGLYLSYLFGVQFPGLLCMTLLAFWLHAIVNNKFLGHTAMIAYFIAISVLPTIGIEHNLLLYGTIPNVTYSDMNGYGPFIAPTFFFSAYWLSAATILLGMTLLLWVRGSESGFIKRLTFATRRRDPGAWALIAVSSLLFIGLGAFIFYNTNILNHYRSGRSDARFSASYEVLYKAKYDGKPWPRVTNVSLDVTLWPRQRRSHLLGTYTLRNTSSSAIEVIPIDLSRQLVIHSLTFDRPVEQIVNDKERGFHVYKMTGNHPLLPGETMRMLFDLGYAHVGFTNTGGPTDLTDNGTFLANITPHIGYQQGSEIADESQRKRYGLPVRRHMAALTDMKARQNTYIGTDADWISFEATVRTDPDQIALAPGYLQREWTENGRRCFHYKMDAPIRNFYSFLSARYKVLRDTWTNGKQTVAIEIYYYPEHTYDLERMVRGVKRSLDYYTRNFSPYQFRQVRILEFPCYQSFAQSFPNTIPYSESIGFIAKVEDGAYSSLRQEKNTQDKNTQDKNTGNTNGDIDYPFYITAHEVAHQWWAHQVLGADVEGSEMLSESLAEYSSLMVMEHEYGRERMRKFLRIDMDRYLRGRSGERDAETPLMRCQHQQYIHYDKGSLIFYALRDYLGEDKLNAILRRFVHDKAFQNPPYTTSAELVLALRLGMPPELQYLITDMFETITLYDNRSVSATSTRIAPHKWRVKLTVAARKVRSDGAGKETPIPMRDMVDIGIFAKAVGSGKNSLGTPLVMEKRRIEAASTTFTYEVSEEPSKAGIDPYNKLIDRQPDDNITAVVAEKGA